MPQEGAMPQRSPADEIEIKKLAARDRFRERLSIANGEFEQRMLAAAERELPDATEEINAAGEIWEGKAESAWMEYYLFVCDQK